MCSHARFARLYFYVVTIVSSIWLPYYVVISRVSTAFSVGFFILFTMTTNHYVAQIMLQTGATEREVITDMMPPLRPMTFPCVIYGRTFDTHDEYIDAMYEYLGSL